MCFQTAATVSVTLNSREKISHRETLNLKEESVTERLRFPLLLSEVGEDE